MIQAVYDCMVFLQAAANPKGAAGACLELAEEGQVRLFLSPPTFAEIQDTLNRPGIQKALPRLRSLDIEQFLDFLASGVNFVAEVPLLERLPRDPKDEPYLNLALAVGAAFLVTRDQDLLSLMEDDSFRQQYPALVIVDPPTFLRQVRAQIARDLGY